MRPVLVYDHRGALMVDVIGTPADQAITLRIEVGDTSAWPANHGLTVCLSVDTTSIKCAGISERTWALTISLLSGLKVGSTKKNARGAATGAPPMPLKAPIRNPGPPNARKRRPGRSFTGAAFLTAVAGSVAASVSPSSACRICARRAGGAAV